MRAKTAARLSVGGAIRSAEKPSLLPERWSVQRAI
jgi:hypothetical protein